MIATEDLLWQGRGCFKRLAREQEETRISVPIKLGQGYCWNGCCMEIVEAENLDLIAGARDSMSGNFRTIAEENCISVPVTLDRSRNKCSMEMVGAEYLDLLELLHSAKPSEETFLASIGGPVRHTLQ